MRPSDIIIANPTPLTATFERTEAEQAAALMIVVLADADDSWRPVTPKEIGRYIRGILDAKEAPPVWMNNPFFRPDIHNLVTRGFARWEGDEDADGRPVGFTEKALEKLRVSRWRRPNPQDS